MSDEPTEKANRYSQIMERVFLSRYEEGASEVDFTRDDLRQVSEELGIKLPANPPDMIYSFRYRNALPQAIRERAPSGQEWIIRPAGRGLYRFVAVARTLIVPNKMMAETKIPDSTPGVIAMYALSDEQSLLAKVRYNRLIDIFTGVACYSLQSHLRTAVRKLGQVETDEVYVGVDKRGAHYVFPVQAKGGRDSVGVVQIEQDIAMCAAKFKGLICQPIAAQFMESDLIALFAFEESSSGIAITSERHYRLVPSEEISRTELDLYRTRPVAE